MDRWMWRIVCGVFALAPFAFAAALVVSFAGTAGKVTAQVLAERACEARGGVAVRAGSQNLCLAREALK